MTPLVINGRRLQREIDELAAISESPAPVVTRVLFSATDLRACAFMKGICASLDWKIRADAVGNLFARWDGLDNKPPAIATDSHIDAIPNAGRYDGVVGVLGGLTAIRALQESGFKPAAQLS